MKISGVTYVYRRRKTHRFREFVITLFILMILGALTLVSISSYVAWKLLHPEILPVKAFASNIAPEYEDILINNPDGGVSLSGWYFRTKNSDKTVILAHGYGSNRLQFGDQTVHMIKQLLNSGYNVLAFDFRNSGKSSSNLSTFGYKEKADLLQAIAKAKSYGAKHIVLMGFSTGAAACILAAAENPDVEALILDSPYADIQEFVNSHLGTWKLSSFPFNKVVLLAINVLAGIDANHTGPQTVIDKIAPRPVLLIHGSGDTWISPQNSRTLKALYASAGRGRTELWEAENAGHLESYEKYPDLYMEKVTTFLESLKTSAS